MVDIKSIIEFIDKHLEKNNLPNIGAVEANHLLEQVRILNDSKDRPGKPLRELLRANKLPHAYQTNGKNSTWIIPHSKNNPAISMIKSNYESDFIKVIHLIQNSQLKAVKAVNTELINLYWEIGKYIHENIEKAQWGQSVVKELAEYLSEKDPELKGFSDKNLWRMKQFYETYVEFPKLSPLVREISWTNNLTILSRSKSMEEREFYLRLTLQERYSKRELERQINSGVFERTMIGNIKLSSVLRETHANNLYNTFKDSYIFEFLGLPELYNEKDLQNGLITQLKNFILELGKDFIFMGEEYRIQVGKSDFFIDLLFYHRGLQCLVAFELKADKFKPEHIGQLNFYLEALDRDVKRPNENPSIGILLCKDKDNEVVEYALNRSLSPTMVSDYQMQLPDKKLLQRKLHELFE